MFSEDDRTQRNRGIAIKIQPNQFLTLCKPLNRILTRYIQRRYDRLLNNISLPYIVDGNGSVTICKNTPMFML